MKRMLTRKPFSKMTGLTLLETMFALAVGALVLIGAVIFYVSTKQSGNSSKAAGDMNAIVAGIQNYTAQGYSLTSLGSADSAATLTPLQNNGYLPNPLLDPWGQSYKAVITGTTAGDTAQVTISIPGINSTKDTPADKSCTAIAQTVLGTASDASVAGTCKFTFNL
jgi:type II secretory pathway pseudopilin PulG